MQNPIVVVQKLVWTSIIIISVGLLPQQGQAADPKLSIGEGATIQIPVGSTDGMVRVMMKAENLTAEEAKVADDPEIKDLGGTGSSSMTTVEFKNAVVADVGTTNRTWLWTARIKNLLANSSQKRSARLTFGKVEQYVEYTITNASPADFTWSVAVRPTTWLVWFGFSESQLSTTVVVTTGNYPASNLRLAQSTLQDEFGTSQIILEDLELCEGPTSPCGQFSVNARTNRTFYVRLKQKTHQGIRQNGKYTGTLSFAVNERPELQTVNITAKVSSLIAKIVGTLFVAFGILLAWYISVFARAKMLRLEALKPVAVLHESITTLKGELKKIQEKIGVDISGDRSIWKELVDIDKTLTTEALDTKDLLPKVLPPPFSDSADKSAKLKENLNTQGEWVTGLTVLVQDGMKKVMEDWENQNKRVAINTALQAFNEKGSAAINHSKGVEAVTAVLDTYNKQNRGLVPEKQHVITHPSTQYLSWEISQINIVGWIIWGMLTWLTGVTVLILTNSGFGTLLDLIFCFFWGFGLPTGIEKLQQLSPSGIAKSIGMNLPMPMTP